jgi:hypothetical protein
MDKSTAAGVTNKTIVPRQAKMMDMRLCGYVVMDPKNNFAITGMLDPKIGQTITPNTTRTPTMKHTKSRMQASGTHPVHRPVAILA